MEVVAIIRFLERTRRPAVTALGLEVPDPYWQMLLALLSRYYGGQPITVSSLASTSGVPYATAFRYIEIMTKRGLIRRRSGPENRKLVFVEPSKALRERFLEYCLVIKREVGVILGSGEQAEQYTFGSSHLVARIIPRPSALTPPLRLGRPLRCLFKDDPSFNSLLRVKSEVETFLGTEIRIDILGYDAVKREALDNARRPASAYDIIALDMPWLGEFSEMGALRCLDDDIVRSSLNVFDFYAAAWEGGQYQSRQMGVPFAPATELLLYRKDLFEQRGLKPPSRLDDVLTAATVLHNPGAELYGISWNAARGQPMGQTFIQILGVFGCPPVSLRRIGETFSLDTRNLELVASLDGDAGRDTLEYLRALAALSPPEIADMDWSGRLSAYRSGRTAMSYEWSSRAASFELDVLSPARGRTGYLPHPAGKAGWNVSPMGGFVLAIPANLAEDEAAEAWRVVAWLCSPEMVKHLIRNGSPVNLRYGVYHDPDVRVANPVLQTVDAMARLGQTQLWQRPPIPQITAFMQIVGEEIHPAVFGRADARSALGCAQRRLERLLAKTGAERFSSELSPVIPSLSSLK